MHEISFIAHFQEIVTVALQTAFFISSFQSYIIYQSILGSILSISFFLWFTSNFQNIDVVLAAVFGFLFGLATVVLLKLPRNRGTFYLVYYFVIQPYLLSRYITLFVVQTNYPIGYIAGYLVWTFINLLVYYYHTPLQKIEYLSVFVVVNSLFFFGFFFYRSPWISIVISGIVHIVVLIIVKTVIRRSKENSMEPE
jgi:tryptophan-rich sensory protein